MVESLTSLSYTVRVGKSMKLRNTRQKAIWNVVQPKYLPVPTNEHWMKNSNFCKDKCHMSKCYGSNDSKYYYTMRCLLHGE
jgi:hypothetical protein